MSCMKKKDIAIRVEVAISRKSRDPSSQMKLRSWRMSVPHASSAMRRHERPLRGMPGLPSRTRVTVSSIVTSSTAMITKTAARGLPNAVAAATRIAPPPVPSRIISPISPLAMPTWRAGTRSGM